MWFGDTRDKISNWLVLMLNLQRLVDSLFRDLGPMFCFHVACRMTREENNNISHICGSIHLEITRQPHWSNHQPRHSQKPTISSHPTRSRFFHSRNACNGAERFKSPTRGLRFSLPKRHTHHEIPIPFDFQQLTFCKCKIQKVHSECVIQASAMKLWPQRVKSKDNQVLPQMSIDQKLNHPWVASSGLDLFQCFAFGNLTTCNAKRLQAELQRWGPQPKQGCNMDKKLRLWLNGQPLPGTQGGTCPTCLP